MYTERLDFLAREIIKAHKAAEAGKITSRERAKQAGEKLIEARKLIEHGEWLLWLNGIGLPDRTARLYIQIARLSPAKSATVADLSLHAAVDAIRQLRPQRPDPAAQRGQPT